MFTRGLADKLGDLPFDGKFMGGVLQEVATAKPVPVAKAAMKNTALAARRRQRQDHDMSVQWGFSTQRNQRGGPTSKPVHPKKTASTVLCAWRLAMAIARIA